MMRPIHFGRWLRNLREKQGWTQEDMARQLGISRQALFLLETGRGYPSMPLAFRIARLCNRSLDELFFNQKSNQGKEVNMFRRWFDPFSELDRMHREIDRMFSESFRPLIRRGADFAGYEFPPVNVRETDKEIIVEATLPGVSAKDLQVNITEDRVSLRGERKEESKVEDKDFIRREYAFGSFAREIMLPAPVKAEEAEATLKNGVMTIKVPKTEEHQARGRELRVKEE